MKKLFILLVILGFGFSLTGCKTEHQHTLVNHEAKQATCTEDGHYAYEECTECDYTTYVKIEALGHKDEDFDHNCDNNCGETLGEHVDTNNDHNCDYGCEQAIGEHVDSNNDHNCDYGCSETFGEHVDTNNDHNCDYCSGTLTECLDEDFDCICDICDKELDFTFDEETNTYYVRTANGLYEWNKYSMYNLELRDNIYLSDELILDLDDDGVNDSNWSPVRVNDGVTINGNGFSIEGIKINTSSFCGFSSQVSEQGLVKNLHLKDVSLNGSRTGGITANNYGTIINCSVSGDITSNNSNQGGIVGYNDGLIIACVNYTNINVSTDGHTGGVVAQMSGGKIVACYNIGNIIGNSGVGGIVGSFFDGDIISSYNLGQVTGADDYGYIAGYGLGTFNSNYWTDLDGDNASTANGFRETQEGCTLINETTTWEVAKVAMNEAIATYNETATIKCEYVYELNTDEDNEPLVLVLQEEQEETGDNDEDDYGGRE